MSASQVAQAAEFVRALHVHLRKMTSDLTGMERQGLAGRTSRDIRSEVAALRRDIAEARILSTGYSGAT